MQSHETLETKGLVIVDTMTIAEAFAANYVNNDKFTLVNMAGDDDSQGLPYTMSSHKIEKTLGGYSLPSSTGKSVTVDKHHLVAVYRSATLDVTTQVQVLRQFASQFDDGSLIKQLLSEDMLQYLLSEECDSPDIFTDFVEPELLTMDDPFAGLLTDSSTDEPDNILSIKPAWGE